MSWLRPIAAPLLAAAVSAAASASAPPTPEQAAGALGAVADGPDRRDEGLFVLLDEVRAGAGPGATPAAAGEVPVVRAGAFLADPAGRRGEAGRLDGVLQQTATLDGPGGAIVEWFLRDAAGAPVAFVLPAESAPAAAAGDRVRAVGRFWKVVEVVPRDGPSRPHPAFVGRGIRLDPPPAGGLALGGPLAAIVLGLLAAAWLALRAVAARGAIASAGASAGRPVVRIGGHVPAGPERAAAALGRFAAGGELAAEEEDGTTREPVPDEAFFGFDDAPDDDALDELPEDPAAALAELARRAASALDDTRRSPAESPDA